MKWNMQVILRKRDVWMRAWYIGLAVVVAAALWAYWNAMADPARALLLGANIVIVSVLAFQEIIGAKLHDWKERLHRSKPTAMPPPQS